MGRTQAIRDYQDAGRVRGATARPVRGKAEQAEMKTHEYVVTPKSGLNTRSCYHQYNKAGYTRRRGTEGCVEVEDRRS